MNNPTDIKVRTKEEIDLDYTSHAVKVGDLEYKIKNLQAQASEQYNQMRAIELEAIALRDSSK